MRVDHIGIAVEDLAAAKKLYGEVLGLKLLFEEEVPTEKVRVAAYDGGGMRIELLESTSPDGPIGRHVASRGPGIHHVCYQVDDVQGSVDRLAAAGVRMIDTAPRPGAGGCRVAFVHPKGALGVLVELSQHPPGGLPHAH
ncbi:MAG: methylmalonyl-CoA epimerase [Planctomycetia bacterium]|nr:methylmalonyl-CoA epimerase [Planctomycetia bacterium]